MASRNETCPSSHSEEENRIKTPERHKSSPNCHTSLGISRVVPRRKLFGFPVVSARLPLSYHCNHPQYTIFNNLSPTTHPLNKFKKLYQNAKHMGRKENFHISGNKARAVEFTVFPGSVPTLSITAHPRWQQPPSDPDPHARTVEITSGCGRTPRENLSFCTEQATCILNHRFNNTVVSDTCSGTALRRD